VALYEDVDGLRREQVHEQPNTRTNREELRHEQVREQVREQLNAGGSWREEAREQIRGPRLNSRAAAAAGVQSVDTERPPSTDDESVLVMNVCVYVCDIWYRCMYVCVCVLLRGLLPLTTGPYW